MVQRLFLDGIDLQRGRRSVAEAVEFSSLVHADEAETGLPFPDVAVARAKVAVHTSFGRGLPPASLVQRFGLLKNCQFLHGSLLKGRFYRSSLLRKRRSNSQVGTSGAKAP